MNLLIILFFFILGIVFGSFYNVVGYRVPLGQSILYPSSHCTKCNHTLKFYELIPILSFIFLGGKCKICKEKISCFYPLFEFFTGILFALCFVVFGLSLECLYAIIFISILLIIIISDYQTMIIPDSVLFIGLMFLIFVKFFIGGINDIGYSLIHLVCAFLFMLILKLFGDFLFKKESMGGGDIKLLGLFGFVLGFPLSIVVVFLSAFIAFPISLIILKTKKIHEIPYGPFLAISAIIIYMTKIDIKEIINFLNILS